jgi:ubiquinone/menaquinone biosynthesis C-methylase UbiE
MRQAQTRREVEAALKARSVDTYADFLLPFLRPNMTVLDCGCGKGTIALGLAQAVPTGWIIGVDIAKACLATLRGHANLLGRENLSCTVADGRRLPFPDETFETVFCHSMLETLGDPENAVVEFRRIIKRDGLVGAASVEYGGIIFGGKKTEGPVRFYEIRQQVWRDLQVAEPNMGRRLRGLFEEAGFRRVEASAAYISYGTTDRVRSFAHDRAVECRDPQLQAAVIRAGIASIGELGHLAVAWNEWGNDPSAFFAFPWCRVLAWR